MNLRLQKCRNLLKKTDVAAVLVTKPENRRYLSGFTGTSGVLVITESDQVLFTDFRYTEQAREEAPDFTILRHETDLLTTVAEWLKKHDVGRLGFESDDVSVEFGEKLKQKVSFAQLAPLKLDPLRQIKDAGELALIKEAVKIADQAFERILGMIRPGMSELDVVVELEYQMRKLGSVKPSFDTIAASGVRGALPHGQGTRKVLARGDFLTLDFGATYEGYCSDITRTVCLGEAGKRQKEIYEVVLAAQLAAEACIAPGLDCFAVDAVARKKIADAGYGDCFGHGLGHSVGLAIHEEPRLSPSCHELLAENMTMTVEPGIYVPGFGGVRIEDLVVVTASGCEILTNSTKELIELDCN